MPDQSRKRWWQRLRISIRGLIVVVIVIGGCLGWIVRMLDFNVRL